MNNLTKAIQESEKIADSMYLTDTWGKLKMNAKFQIKFHLRTTIQNVLTALEKDVEEIEEKYSAIDGYKVVRVNDVKDIINKALEEIK